MSLAGSLDIGKRAIMTQTQALKVVGENISNVSTPGYSRKRLELKSTIHAKGQDISLLEVRRIRDQFIDKHIRKENQSLGSWEMKSQLYGQIERVFLEPSESGLKNLLGEFWNSWEDLSNNPENITSRGMVIQRGISLAQSINRIDSQLKDMRKTTDGYINDRLEQVNDKAGQVAYLNSQIQFMEASGQEASSLRDHRDQLVDQLSKLINVTSVERDNGSVTLYIGGRTIVEDAQFNELESHKVSQNGMVITNIKWADDGSSVEISDGDIEGLMEIRDEVILDLSNKMNLLSETIINSVNELHKTGYGLDGGTGRDFFLGSNASNLRVNDDPATDIVNHPDRLGASLDGEAGDNEIAINIARLSEIMVTSSGVEAPNDPDAINISRYYSEIVNSLGTDTNHASLMLESSQMLVTDYEEYRESVSGVSLDEETAELIRLQRAYESATKYMSVIDEMMQTLINLGR